MTSTHSSDTPASGAIPDQQRRFGPFRVGRYGSPAAGAVDLTSDSAFARLEYAAATPRRPAMIRLALSGEIDLAEAVLLEDTLDRVMAFPPWPITVDLSAVTFVGSSVLSFLAALHNHTAASRQAVTVTGVGPMARRSLQLCGFDRVLTITADTGADGQ